MKNWVYRVDTAARGSLNMQRDRHAYGLFQAEPSLPLLRFYTWSEPTLSLGRFQTPEPQWLQHLQNLGIPVVRRPTGGQAILHQGDLCFSLIGPADQLSQSLLATHREISQALLQGLHSLQIEAQMAPIIPGRQDYRQQVPCFASLTPVDIQAHDRQDRPRKLIGSAQVRCRKAFLQQSVIYCRTDQSLHRAVFGESSGQAAEGTEILDLEQIWPGAQELSLSQMQAQVIQAVLQGFQAVFEIEWQAATPLEILT